MTDIMTKRAKNLRRNATDAENHLWYYLRARRLNGYKFKRQEVIGAYIADFICYHKRLIIELDGGQHVDAVRYDEKRTSFLQSKGFRVLRFWNNTVFEETKMVLTEIINALESKMV